MKKHFEGYYKLTKKQFEKLWDNCIFSFDANVLLNLYRYSIDTRSDLIKIINSISDRIWIPHQVALEFHRNRLAVIVNQSDTYTHSIKQFEKYFNSISDSIESKTHPYLKDSSKYLTSLKKTIDEIIKNLEKEQKKYSKLIENDLILSSLSTLFSKNVGEPYNDEKLNSLYKEGESRYKEEIPPGYLDTKTKIGKKIYGDLIIWNQLIDKSIEDKTPIIFITNEKKADWWQIIKDSIMGPRPELINEFKVKTNNQFYLYHINNFMKNSDEYLNQAVKQSTIKEMNALTEYDQTVLRNLANEISHSFNKEAIREMMGLGHAMEESLKSFSAQKQALAESLKGLQGIDLKSALGMSLSDSLKVREAWLKQSKGLEESAKASLKAFSAVSDMDLNKLAEPIDKDLNEVKQIDSSSEKDKNKRR